MNKESLLTAIKNLLIADIWPGGSTVVYPSGSVFISRAADLQTLIDSGIRFPMAQIMPGDFRSDPQHDEEPDLMVGPVVVRIATAVPGDAVGQNPLVGANKTGGTTSSKGRGLLELEPRLHAVIGDLNALEGIVLQWRRSGDSGSVLYNNLYVSWEDFIFEAICDESTTASSDTGDTMQSVVKTADQTVQTATPTDPVSADDLSFAVEAGKTYYFLFQCIFQTSDLNNGLSLGVTFPTFVPPTVVAGIVRIPFSSAGSSSMWAGPIVSSDGLITATQAPAANTNYMATIEGIITPGEDGTLQVRFAGETVLATVTMKAGSMGQLYEIAS